MSMLVPTAHSRVAIGGDTAGAAVDLPSILQSAVSGPGFFSPLLVLVIVVLAAGTWWAGPRRHVQFLREVGLIAFAYASYSTVRSVTEGEVGEALLNAERIIEFEERLGFFWEPDLQSLIVDADWAITLVNWMYVWGHWPLIGLAAIWMWRIDIAVYRLFRNAFLLSGAIGLFFYWLLPTAPPRLTDLDFLDTVAVYSDSYRVFQPPDFVNQYAAFPSLHFGWNLLIAIALIYHFRGNRAAAAVAIFMPMAMLAAIVFSANHFFVDAVGGAAVALAGLGLALLLHRRRRPDVASGDGPPAGGRRTPAPHAEAPDVSGGHERPQGARGRFIPTQ